VKLNEHYFECGTSNSKLFPILKNLLSSSCLADQQKCLTVFMQHLKDMNCKDLSHEPISGVVKTLVSILFSSDASVPLKKQIMRLFCSFPTEYFNEISSTIQQYFIQDERGNNCLDSIDSISLCLHYDFSLGLTAVLSMVDEISLLLSNNLEVLANRLEKNINEDHTATKKIMSILKTLSVIFSKGCSLEFTTFQALEKVLVVSTNMKNLPLDCHTSVAICWLHLKQLENDMFLSHNIEGILKSASTDLIKLISTSYALLTSWSIMSDHQGQLNDLLTVFVYLNGARAKEDDMNVALVLLLTKCLSQWSLKVNDLLSKATTKLDECLEDEISILLQFVWAHWEHPMDCLKHHLLDIFENVLKIKSRKCSSETFEKKLLSVLFKENHFLLLSSFVKVRGASTVLELIPKFPSQVLKMMLDSSYACQITKLVYQCIQSSDQDQHLIWVSALADSLIENTICSKWILSTLIPKLIRFHPHILKLLSTFLFDASKSMACAYGALMKCLRLCKQNGIDLQEGTFDVLKHCLTIDDENISLEAFAYLAEVKKPSLPISKVDLNQILLFLRNNTNSQSPSFRQNLFALLGNLLTSICVSAGHIKKNDPTIYEEIFMVYKEFIKSLVEIFMEGLKPSANYPRRTSSLNNLKCLFDNIWADALGEEIFPISEYLNANEHALLLIRCLSDTYENNMELALQLLKKFFEVPNFGTLSLSFTQLWNEAFKKLFSTKPQDSLSACYMIRFLLFTKEKDLINTLQFLLMLLKDQLDVAKQNIVVAAESAPMYGTLICLRYILWNDIGCNLSNEMLIIINQVMDLCFFASEIVVPIVSASSPEGFMIEPPPNQTLKPVSIVTPQMLLLCCWRTMKEVSLHLGIACEKLNGLEFEGKLLLPTEKIIKIGNDFFDQMRMNTHRGAFEVGYEGFSRVTKVLWASKNPKLHDLPEQWLTKLLKSSQYPDVITNTRRSAGLPYCVVAVLAAAQPRYSKKGSEMFARTMTILLDFARHMEEASVHSMNILRMIVKDTRFGDSVIPYIGESFMVSIPGFTADHWKVRNASTLLFSALMQRTFGVNSRSHNDDTDELPPPKKNCMTTLEFFTRFNSMRQFIFDILNNSSKNPKRLDPCVFPVLLVLSRLLPSPEEEKNGKDSIRNFVPVLKPCLSSPIMKTRSLAAKALVPMFDLSLLKDLVKIVLHENDHNKLHGSLLALKYYTCQNQAAIYPEHFDVLLELFPFHLSNQLRSNLFIQSTYWDIHRSLLEIQELLDKKYSAPICFDSLKSLVNSFIDFYLQKKLQHVPGFSYALKASTTLFCKLFDKEPVNSCQILKDMLQASNSEITYAISMAMLNSKQVPKFAKSLINCIITEVHRHMKDRDCLTALLKLLDYLLSSKTTCTTIDNCKIVLDICDFTHSETTLEIALACLCSMLNNESFQSNILIPRIISILELSADPEQSACVRLRAAKILTVHSQSFLQEVTLVDVRIKFWNLCYGLSKDEEENIRAVIKGKFLMSNQNILDIMVDDMAKQFPWNTFSALTKEILRPLVEIKPNISSELDAQFLGAELLFDKGEANSYAEERWDIICQGKALETLWEYMVESKQCLV